MKKRTNYVRYSETQIQSAILKVLDALPGGLVLRYRNNPLWDNKNKQYIRTNNRFCPRGAADIFFFYLGKSYAIEVKTEKEYRWLMNKMDDLQTSFPQSKKEIHAQAQMRFLEWFNKTGNRGFFTYSVDHCLNEIEGYRSLLQYD